MMEDRPLWWYAGFSAKTHHAKETAMGVKYVGVDVHGQTCVFHVLDDKGTDVLGGAVVPTRKEPLLEFVKHLGGTVHLALEEGTQAQWFRALVRPFVEKVVVCNARKNTRGRTLRNKTDRKDARSLARLLYQGELSPVYHGDEDLEEFRNLVKTYQVLLADTTRAKNRIKAVYRARGIPTDGNGAYGRSTRQQYLEKATSSAVRSRLEAFHVQMDIGTALVQQARSNMLLEARKYCAYRTLMTVPGIGRIGAAVLVATIGTPRRFPTKQAFWAYCGLAVIHRESGEHVIGPDGIRRRSGPTRTYGLNRNRNGSLKGVFKVAAIAARKDPEVEEYYQGLLARGLRPEVARVQLARKLATVALTIWKKGCRYEKGRLKQQNA